MSVNEVEDGIEMEDGGDLESLHSELEDDDYDLIEENLGVKVKRKRFKRVKRIVDDSSDEDERPGGERDAIAQQLFEGSDNEDEGSDRIADIPPRDHYSSDSDEYSETDDFIVDEDGEPINDRRKRKRGSDYHVDPSMQQAQELFGGDFDYSEFEQYRSGQSSDESAAEDPSSSKRKRSRELVKKPICQVYEPEELERLGYTDKAQKIRNTDVPERHQLRRVPVTPATEEELEEEAEWICKKQVFTCTKSKAAAAVAAASIVAPAPQSDANWGQDWDAKTNAPPAATTAPAPAPEVNNGWEDNWDEGSTASATNAAVAPRPEPIPSAPKSNANWDSLENWDAPEPVSKKVLEQQAPLQDTVEDVSGGWGDDWDTKTTVPEPDFVDWKRPAAPKARRVPAPEPAPSASSENPPDNSWAERDWDSQSAVNLTPALGGAGPLGATSTVDSSVVPQPAVEEVQDISKILPKVKAALNFIRNENFEVPYIVFYKKDYVFPDLSLMDMWKVFEMDEEFTSLHLRKEKLAGLIAGVKEFQIEQRSVLLQSDSVDDTPLITDEHIDRVRRVKTIEDLRDFEAHFRLHYAPDVARRKVLQGKPVTQCRQGKYAKMMSLVYMPSFLRAIGLTSEQFSENLRDKYQRHEVTQCETGPGLFAYEIVEKYSLRSRPEDVTQVLMNTYSIQLGHEPLLRQCVRSEMFEKATVTVFPTSKGQTEINEVHQCYSLKYIKGKPIRAWKGDEFMRVANGEKDGLLNVVIEEPREYFAEIKELIQKDEFSRHVQEWNDLRETCLKMALENTIYPVIRKEVHQHLLTQAQDFVIAQCGQKLHRWLSKGPMTVEYPEMKEHEWRADEGIRVLAIAYDEQFLDSGAMATILKPDGELDIRVYKEGEQPSDHLRLQHILRYSATEKAGDLRLLKDLICDAKPHIILISGESLEAIKLRADVRQVVSELDADFPQIQVEIVPNDASKVYASSKKAEADLGKECPVLLRQAISIARRAQDPLLELAQLCTPDDDLLCVKLHPLQDDVPKDRLKRRLEIEFINRTCDVGVDINKALTYPHTDSVVQFIAGLGQIKAAWLLRSLRRNTGRLESRDVLLTSNLMANVVFCNCAGFIKIDSTDFEDSSDTFLEILDGTRVHPLSYEMARQMCSSALYDNEETREESPSASAVEKIVNSADRSLLDELDLERYAKYVMEKNNDTVSSLLTMVSIKEELIERYKDHRPSYESPEEDELLNMLTKETPETLHIGRLVTVRVARVVRQKTDQESTPAKDEATGKWYCTICGKSGFEELTNVWHHLDAFQCPGRPVGVKAFMDNGMSGLIPLSKLSDKIVRDPDERVFPGQTISCRITKIFPERQQVEFTSRSSDLNDDIDEWKPPKDAYYDAARETLDFQERRAAEARKTEKKVRSSQGRRLIVHPSFHDVTYVEAEKMLESMEQGDVIVRPSSKGIKHLTVTWKVCDGIAQHVDVLEKEKSSGGGQVYIVEGDDFDDIDEIIARHVNPKGSNARDVINYRYYIHNIMGDLPTAEEYLAKEKAKNPKKIHYVLHPSTKYPGKFFLSYIPKQSAIHEMITATQEGLRYRQRVFGSLNDLLAWFKVHYKDPPPTGTPIISKWKDDGGSTVQRTPGYETVNSYRN